MTTPPRALPPFPSGKHILLVGVALAAVIVGTPPTIAEDSWKPFAEKDAAVRRGRPPSQPEPTRQPEPGLNGAPPAPPAYADQTPAWARPPATAAFGPAPGTSPARPNTIESSELAPVMSPDGSGLPLDLWNGLDLTTVEQLLARLEIPPRSAAVHNLWSRLLQADATAPGNAGAKFQALRAEAYQRSGLLKEEIAALTKATATSADPVLSALKGRAAISVGDSAGGCSAIKDAGGRKAELPKRLKGEIIILAGYCAALGGNHAAAGLAADLAREEGVDAPLALAALDAIAAGPEAAKKQKLALPKRIDATDYRLIELTAPQDLGTLLEKADPSLLSVLVSGEAVPSKLRLASAEAAARINVITPERLAEVYRSLDLPQGEGVDPMAAKSDPLTRRAQLFRAAEIERTPQRKTRLLRAVLDDGRRYGLYLPLLRITAGAIEALQPQVEIGWFAETAVEAMIAAGRYDEARKWVAFGQGLDRSAPAMGGSSLQHWLALIDIADPANRGAQRGANLESLERLALAGRFAPELLHRLATVLDALDYQVPLPLWEAASRTPQPNTGHLPETGVLTELQDASKKKEFARTVLLVLRTLGPEGAEGAHMIALGDAVRALKRANLEPDARRLAFEALFAGWPRSTM